MGAAGETALTLHPGGVLGIVSYLRIIAPVGGRLNPKWYGETGYHASEMISKLTPEVHENGLT
jgi:hypothetical protein